MAKGYRSLFDKEQEEMRRLKFGDIRRGDVFYFSKMPTVGVEQQGGRPGVIVSNDMCNSTSNFVLVCYLTTQPKTNMPTHVPVMCEQKSICLCEQVHTLSTEKMEKYCCTLTNEEMAEIDKALIVSLGIDLNNITSGEYPKLLNDLENQVKTQEDEIENLYEELKIKDEKIKTLTSDYINAVNDAKISNREPVSIENIPEYIRVCAERDVYIKLYKDLLESRE